ncbi:regenerating islet-derived protein 4-like [Sceloporus undulatus]|uniref:regenerating islet-derived protein 4-like n=1 Tax=Sceloporus undulatus TaxID=8520 RepID=UPI001C4CF093|nr:regenerating islet-derived protein 4-like [Sceloporus undulatus]
MKVSIDDGKLRRTRRRDRQIQMGTESWFHFSLLGLLFISFFPQGSQGIKCQSGWFQHDRNCYGYFPERLNWNHAEIECMSYGRNSHLASILHDREMDAVAVGLKTFFKLNGPVWIGLYNIGTKRWKNWRWIDMAAFDYLPWGYSGYNRLKGKGDCGAMPHWNLRAWKLMNCRMAQAYLCKMTML